MNQDYCNSARFDCSKFTYLFKKQYRVLRKDVNQKYSNSWRFDCSKFTYLFKKQ